MILFIIKNYFWFNSTLTVWLGYSKTLFFQDYAVLDEESNRIAEQCREQQAFYEQQRGNNVEASRENSALTQRLGHTRQAHSLLLEQVAALHSEVSLLY